MAKVDMSFGLTESLPKALSVGPLFPRKNTAAAKKSRLEMEQQRQEKIKEKMYQAKIKMKSKNK